MHNHIEYRLWRPDDFGPTYRAAVERYHRCNTEDGNGCDDCRGLSSSHIIFRKRECDCPEGEAALQERGE